MTIDVRTILQSRLPTGPTGPAGSTGALTAWSTKTSNYTLVNGDRVIANTSGGSFTLTLPATPTTGVSIQVTDGSSWYANNLTIARNGSTIEGFSDDLLLDVPGATVELVYDGTTWQVIASVGIQGDAGPTGPASTVTGPTGPSVTGPTGPSGDGSTGKIIAMSIIFGG